MERRKLLQALTAIPAMVISGKNGEQVGVKYEVKPDKKYVVLISEEALNIDDFCENNTAIPPGTSVHVVKWGVPMDEAIRIYEVEKS